MSMIEWAKEELDLLVENNDSIQIEINKNIMELVEVFAKQGHTGFTASYTIGILNRLIDHKPITPLTGSEDEWEEVFDKDSNTQQNKRCSAVFRKDFDNSTAYYIDGKVFSDDGGETWYTNKDSRIPVIFPFRVPEHPEKVILKNSKGEDE